MNNEIEIGDWVKLKKERGHRFWWVTRSKNGKISLDNRRLANKDASRYYKPELGEGFDYLKNLEPKFKPDDVINYNGGKYKVVYIECVYSATLSNKSDLEFRPHVKYWCVPEEWDNKYIPYNNLDDIDWKLIREEDFENAKNIELAEAEIDFLSPNPLFQIGEEVLDSYHFWKHTIEYIDWNEYYKCWEYNNSLKEYDLMKGIDKNEHFSKHEGVKYNNKYHVIENIWVNKDNEVYELDDETFAERNEISKLKGDGSKQLTLFGVRKGLGAASENKKIDYSNFMDGLLQLREIDFLDLEGCENKPYFKVGEHVLVKNARYIYGQDNLQPAIIRDYDTEKKLYIIETNSRKTMKYPGYALGENDARIWNARKENFVAEIVHSLNKVADKKYIARQAELNKLVDKQTIGQLCEKAVYEYARQITGSDRVIFENLKLLYSRQPKVEAQDGKARKMQQFSTPCPISWLIGRYTLQDQPKNGDYSMLEPTAGNGLLTLAFEPKNCTVNELDEIRFANLQMFNRYRQVLNEDANTLSVPDRSFDYIVTNPPFGTITNRNDYLVKNVDKGDHTTNLVFEKLEHKLAILALEKMKDNGRAAIIIGGEKEFGKNLTFQNTYWNQDGTMKHKQLKMFLSYLNRQYNLVDVIYISGDIYEKQGAAWPIIVILIDGRKKWNPNPDGNYRKYDSNLDYEINNFDDLFTRIYKHINK